VIRPITAHRWVNFGTAYRGCWLRARCTTAREGRSLNLHPHEALLRAHRARAADPGFQATSRRHRPMSNAASPGSPAATAACPTAG
jgi:hypothetical protein